MKAIFGAMIVALTANLAVAQVDYQPPAKPKLGTKVGISPEDFKNITAGLEENAAVKLDGQTPNRDALSALRDVQYDKATWEMVKKYLKSLNTLALPKVKRGDKLVKVNLQECHKLYIICALTEPLLISKPEVIREALGRIGDQGSVRDLESHVKYMDIPKYKNLKACEFPQPVKGVPPKTDDFTKMDKAREEKGALEEPAILNNQCIGELENIYCSMLAYAEDKNADDELAGWILTNESKKMYIWRVGVEALNSESASGEMSKARAKNLYKTFYDAGKRRLGSRDVEWVAHYKDNNDRQISVEWAYRWYRVYHMPDPSKDDITPNFTLSWDYPGYVLLTTAKYLDMVVKGVKDPADKSVLVVHNPQKGDSPTWKGPEQPERKWKDDPERWMKENTLTEKAPQGFKQPG